MGDELVGVGGLAHELVVILKHHHNHMIDQNM